LGDAWLVAVVPRLPLRLALAGLVPESPDELPLTPPLGALWDDSAVLLPDDAPCVWRDALTDRRASTVDGTLRVADVLSTLPVGIMTGTRS
jgi:hypothetical protein